MPSLKRYLIAAMCTSYIAAMLFYLAYGNNSLYYDLQYSCIAMLCLFFSFSDRTPLNKSFISELLGIDIVLLFYTKYARYAKEQFRLTGHENWNEEYQQFIHPKTWLLAAIIGLAHVVFVIVALHLFKPKHGAGTTH